MAPGVLAAIDAEGARLRSLLSGARSRPAANRDMTTSARPMRPAAAPRRPTSWPASTSSTSTRTTCSRRCEPEPPSPNAAGDARTFVDGVDGRDVRAWQRQINRQRRSGGSRTRSSRRRLQPDDPTCGAGASSRPRPHGRRLGGVTRTPHQGASTGRALRRSSPRENREAWAAPAPPVPGASASTPRWRRSTATHGATRRGTTGSI